jgi:tRNA nucleotidyltransferase (CCA-adding enzyme)
MARLRSQNFEAYLVGGAVRDLLLGKQPKDFDVATDARPDDLLRAFPKAVPTGLQHGTVTVVEAGAHYEVTTLRGESAYSDGRHPDAVRFVDDITADLARRDFTVNALAVDPSTGAVIDPFGGKCDLQARVLRAVGAPRERFAEDGLRVLRAARFVATLEFELDPATAAAIAPTLDTFRKVSPERVRDEWLKTMKARSPSRAFEVMRTSGMLGVTCPELLESVGCTQNRHHAYDVWGHAMACLDAAPAAPVLRVAALLHDITELLVVLWRPAADGQLPPAVAVELPQDAVVLLQD